MSNPHTMTIGHRRVASGSGGKSRQSDQKGDQREADPNPDNPDMFAGGRAVRGDHPAIVEEIL